MSARKMPVCRPLAEHLHQAVQLLALDLSESKQSLLIDYLSELQKWNRTYNLTALRTVEDMLIQHIFDCLAVVPALEAYEKKNSFTANVIADIGSGAGLPAVVLAIVRPQARIISVDAVQKKTSFVQHVANKLGLVNLEPRHSRVEAIKNISADLVISRAFTSLPNFIDLTSHLVSQNGVLAAMKSRQLETEITELKDKQGNWFVHQVDEINVPDMQATRYVAWLRRKNNE